jgi:hypothetical protein
MPRKGNPTKQVIEAIDTPLNLEFEQVCSRLGISEPELRDRLENQLKEPQVQRWTTIPIEHESVIEAIRRDVESEASVRSLNLRAAQLPPVPPAPTPAPQETRELSEEAESHHHESSALTEKKSQAIKDTREAATQTNNGVSETLTLLQAQQGLIDSSQAGTAYLATYTANLTNVKGEGLTVIAAQMIQEISQKSGFDPNEILKKVGVPLSAETQQKLQQTMGQVLGKVQAASTEIQQTTWGNGYNLTTEIGNLDELMKPKSTQAQTEVEEMEIQQTEPHSTLAPNETTLEVEIQPEMEVQETDSQNNSPLQTEPGNPENSQKSETSASDYWQ